MIFLIASAAVMTLAFALVAIAPWGLGGKVDVKATRKLILGLSGANLIAGLILIGLGLLFLFAPRVVHAAGLTQAAQTDQYASLGAAIAAGLGSIAAGYGVGTTGSAAIGVIAEKPEAFGRVLIFVGLAEGTAIYGLIIAFIILTR